jgi:hypothetical protein
VLFKSWYPKKLMFEAAEPKNDLGLMMVMLVVEVDKVGWVRLVGRSNPHKVQKEFVLDTCQGVKNDGLNSLMAALVKAAGW